MAGAGNAFPFIGGAYTARSKAFDAQRCVNLYPEVSESGPAPSKNVASLIGTPGRVRWSTLAGGGVRGLQRFSAAVGVGVVGGNIYRLDTAGNGTLIGTAPDDGLPVSMDTNGSLVFITTTQGSVAINPLTGASVSVSTPSTSCGFVDGRIVLSNLNTGQFVYTGLYNSTVDPLNFETAEGAPDNLLSLAVVHREVWLFGEYTTEIFGPTGDSNTPFARIGNAFIETGIAAPRSVGKMDNTVYWLSADKQGQGVVVRAVGYEPQRVSTHAIEYAIASYSRIDDAVAFTYQQEGHNFYQLTFPTAGKTWVFDSRSGLWHERAYRRPTDGGLEQVREQCQMSFAGKILVGDRNLPRIYALDLNTYTDDGDPILRLRSCPHLWAAGARQSFYALELLLETGVGDGTTGQGGDPQARLRWSDDGGVSFGSREMWAPMGKIGERQRRVRWRRLGSSIDRVFEVAITDPVRVCMIGATANVVVGT
jgi:hypothetical protein